MVIEILTVVVAGRAVGLPRSKSDENALYLGVTVTWVYILVKTPTVHLKICAPHKCTFYFNKNK